MDESQSDMSVSLIRGKLANTASCCRRPSLTRHVSCSLCPLITAKLTRRCCCRNFNHAQGAGYQSGTTGGFTPKLAVRNVAYVFLCFCPKCCICFFPRCFRWCRRRKHATPRRRLSQTVSCAAGQQAPFRSKLRPKLLPDPHNCLVQWHHTIRFEVRWHAMQAAMNATDTLINGFLNSLEAAGTLSTTAIIIAAKHGQNPLNPSKVGASVVFAPCRNDVIVTAPPVLMGPRLNICGFISDFVNICPAVQPNQSGCAEHHHLRRRPCRAGGPHPRLCGAHLAAKPEQPDACRRSHQGRKGASCSHRGWCLC